MRRLRAYFLALVAMAGCFLVASLGLLDASLRERRRRADESGPGNGGEDAARMLGARVAAQSELIGNLTSRLGTIARLQRLVSERLGGAPAMGSVPLAHDGGAAAGATAGPPPRARAVPPTPHAVVIFCFNRPQYLQRAMRSVLSRLPTDGSYTLAVSQDGDEPGVADVVRAEGGPAVLHLRHARALVALGRGQQRFAGYHCLAQHYGWALAELLEARGFESVIVLEDDIEVAPDFFGFFKAMAPLLDEDDSLLTVSAFADNGQPQHVHDPAAAYRSDFFPGLGWMMTRRLWAELGPKWPASFWDDWLREPANRRGRATIRPEISRSYTYGVKGTSSGQFSTFLKAMQLAQVGVDWAATDVRALTRARYDAQLDAQLAAAREVAPAALPARGQPGCGDLRVPYSSRRDFERLAKLLGLMPELKAGVPRTAYRGVVTFRRGTCRVFLAPTYAVDPETHSILQPAPPPPR